MEEKPLDVVIDEEMNKILDAYNDPEINQWRKEYAEKCLAGIKELEERCQENPLVYLFEKEQLDIALAREWGALLKRIEARVEELRG